ncbi:MAG: hypothetical protein COU63_02275 [Candidatus Pacebacteria bacterium CG10_big_fil_rev_8_21_14_0_10_36_11]|nr:hypothetical protein [Candidatus Pacearchaeota archaeon]OIP73600.1 MAG: hypothetical protein AUK08_03440 [Candidatus Pacebacteria bacterium CG2_30_36_39]PIR64819.1 MAG: hypothetical protein COU63_02275 [Candidatus Pacebacteria bacterium CG10_big_fil_rev_8_21_14_0_10_36_11]PJC42585.1 MAG: hypothetical protein CO040_03640 [Candidatus Pacebacteria bacterium CG_4_9_14_0_2_um_filter_36_8]
MTHSFKTGLSFGLTSGIITTLGLIVGLHAGSATRMTILGGILTIAIADAFSDALGIHISEESENVHTNKEIWLTTYYTFFAKFISALIFILPFLFLPLFYAVAICILWGVFSLIIFNYFLAKEQNENPIKVISEHLFISFLVIIITNFVGRLVANFS